MNIQETIVDLNAQYQSLLDTESLAMDGDDIINIGALLRAAKEFADENPNKAEHQLSQAQLLMGKYMSDLAN